MYVSKARLAIGTSLMALTFGMLGGGTAYAFQEHMFNARNDLQQAVNELNQAEHDKGGHRENAVGLVQQAINQVSRHCGWWGHALAAEVAVAVRRGAHSLPAQSLLRRSSDVEPEFDDIAVGHRDQEAPPGVSAGGAHSPFSISARGR